MFCLAASISFGGTWSGALVDARCYASAESNKNPDDTSLADRDMAGMVRECAPTAKTKVFAIVQDDWESLDLNADGDAKVAALVQRAGHRPVLQVTVTGTRRDHRIEVDSIAERR
jgi:hypothetical protein